MPVFSVALESDCFLPDTSFLGATLASEEIAQANQVLTGPRIESAFISSDHYGYDDGEYQAFVHVLLQVESNDKAGVKDILYGDDCRQHETEQALSSACDALGFPMDADNSWELLSIAEVGKPRVRPKSVNTYNVWLG